MGLGLTPNSKINKLGSSVKPWQAVYANYLYGIASRSEADSEGNKILTTYARSAGLKGKGNETTPVYIDANGNAVPITSYGGVADKASKDGRGRTISTTYLTKTEAGTTYALQSEVDNLDASKIVSGVIDIARIPLAALERLVVVDTEEDRLALTQETVQVGDTVKVDATEKLYMVIDDTKLDSEEGYTVYVAETAAKAVADEDGNNIKTTYAPIEAPSFTGSSTMETLTVSTELNIPGGKIWIE